MGEGTLSCLTEVPPEGTWDQSLATPRKVMTPVKVILDGDWVHTGKGHGSSGRYHFPECKQTENITFPILQTGGKNLPNWNRDTT